MSSKQSGKLDGKVAPKRSLVEKVKDYLFGGTSMTTYYKDWDWDDRPSSRNRRKRSSVKKHTTSFTDNRLYDDSRSSTTHDFDTES